jgi:MFS family permease
MAMAVGMFCGGGISDLLCNALGVRRSRLVVALGGMGSCAAFSLIGASLTDPNAIVWCFSLAFAALGVCEGNFWTTAPSLAPRNGGLAAAILNTGGNGIGMLAPIFTPILGQHYGWDSAVIVASVICAFGGLLWFGITLSNHEATTDET